MSLFPPAYKLERKHEGFYANIEGDGGGETYAGVARNIYGTWSGWNVVDRYKLQLGRALKWNEEVPGIELYVEAFYKALWDGKNFGAITNQDVANIVYDYFINSGGTGIKNIQRVLNQQFGTKLSEDGSFGPNTINAINAQDPAKLHDAIKQRRIDFYTNLANQLRDYVVKAGDTIASIAKKFKLTQAEIPGPLVAGKTIKIKTQKQFEKGWLDRINSFPTLAKVGLGIAGILTAVGLFFLVNHLINQNSKTT